MNNTYVHCYGIKLLNLSLAMAVLRFTSEDKAFLYLSPFLVPRFPDNIPVQYYMGGQVPGFWLDSTFMLYTMVRKIFVVSHPGCLPKWSFRVPWLFQVFPDLHIMAHNGTGSVQSWVSMHYSDISDGWQSSGPALHYLTLPPKKAHGTPYMKTYTPQCV